ncbi:MULTISPECIES: hypothetical protein [unclassified Sphingobium]|uniref:hypothetical protein n=1 Tax=unclassified Sphingobium TaxID=2611147 RepID=UPI0022258D36|nr:MULTISPECIES: hypothetical protein [unclassified Sphingobium]MCW2412596.1 hypothetical protein [Sphingobium sp. B8D3D]MCW2415107.1 hypothetical protein [Sphingobium sp. B8D3A]
MPARRAAGKVGASNLIADLLLHHVRLVEQDARRGGRIATLGQPIRFVRHDGQRCTQRMGEIASRHAPSSDQVAHLVDMGIEVVHQRRDLGGIATLKLVRRARAAVRSPGLSDVAG